MRYYFWDFVDSDGMNLEKENCSDFSFDDGKVGNF